MVWTYTTGYLTTSGTTASLYKVRLMIGDNDTTRQQLQDEEIYGAISYESSPTLAAAVCCDYLVAKYAFLCNVENGSLRISAAARHSHYRKLAETLRKGGAGDVPGDSTIVSATAYVGGSSKTAVDALKDDTDNILSPFRVGQDDHPDLGVSSSTSGW